MKSYYLWTIGCQMNDADAATISHGLNAMGLSSTVDAQQADLLILITCVVRQSAEDKVVGRLTSLKHLKQHRPEAIIIVMGCFVADVPALQHRFPYVDAFLGPSDLQGLFDLAAQHMRQPPSAQKRPVGTERSAISALVPISYGCDHHCTYCIVRLRRGSQQSRLLPEILSDVASWVQRGAREVTLLGQNVDAYGQDLPAGSPDLAHVLHAVHRFDELWRIRFLTSHPGNLSDRLIQAVAQLPKVCSHFELPVQSGDDDILRRMGRRYTVQQYRDLVACLRQRLPDCSIATDVIVGFPGEDESQFQATYNLLSSLRFDAVHIAKYSPRPETPAAVLTDSVPAAEKERRRALLEELQTHIVMANNTTLLGKTVKILVEDRHRGRWRGRTVTNKHVFFEHGGDWQGQLATVRITWAGPWSLRGEPVENSRAPTGTNKDETTSKESLAEGLQDS
ncbi:MAG: tRNA (N6-isopentenyl adenosine(37)-C2)-methylthiotransferase MiaB [Chloroflexi bacterium]|nr:tRNA (N6-isopentenyl adenosine(37)-C2)-methylthiotransferase MiaB [Chloroflexota bacterium]